VLASTELGAMLALAEGAPRGEPREVVMWTIDRLAELRAAAAEKRAASNAKRAATKAAKAKAAEVLDGQGALSFAMDASAPSPVAGPERFVRIERIAA
jgi:hypothetical protein